MVILPRATQERGGEKVAIRGEDRRKDETMRTDVVGGGGEEGCGVMVLLLLLLLFPRAISPSDIIM